jgi:hypothetical protein
MRSILPIQAGSHPYADLGILRCEQNTRASFGSPLMVQNLAHAPWRQLPSPSFVASGDRTCFDTGRR